MIRFSIPHLLVCAFLFLLPTQLGTYFFFEFSHIRAIRTDYLAPALFLSDIVAVLLIGFHFKTVFAFFRQRWVLIVLGLLVVNVLFSLIFPVSVFKFVKLVEWVALFAIFREMGGNSAIIAQKTKLLYPWNWYLWSLVASTFIQFGLALAQFINKHTLQGIFYWLGERAITVTTPDAAVAALNGNLFLRPYGSFSHPNSMGGFFLLLYFFVQGWEPFKKYPRVRTVTLFIAMLTIFLTFSKTAIGVFVILNMLVFVEVLFKMQCKLCGIARTIVLLVIAAVFFAPQSDPENIAKRVTLIDNAVQIIAADPLTGTGLGTYVAAQSQFPNPYRSYFLQPVHNIILLWIAEAGLVLGGLILIMGMRRVLPLLSYKPFFYCFLAVFISGMMDHYWLSLQQNILVTAVLFGLLSGKARSIIGTRDTRSYRY